MVIKAFPPVESSDDSGLLAIGGDLEVESLLLAYRNGIFPWPFQEDLIAWFSPPKRALLFLEEVRIPRSLMKGQKKQNFSITINQDFRKVISACRTIKNRPRQAGTWITEEVVDAYCSLHERGYAHSIECRETGELTGGLYGVSIGGMFAGESMFYLKPNASKYCLAFLVTYLKERAIPWLDCQVMTPHMKQWGAREVQREEYLELLKAALKQKVQLFK